MSYFLRASQVATMLWLVLVMLGVSMASAVPVPFAAESPIYLGTGYPVMEVRIGTPPMHAYLMIDTGSNFIWTQCNPCVRCYEQISPILVPANSSSSNLIPCNDKECKKMPLQFSLECTNEKHCPYIYEYGLGDEDYYTTGTLRADTFTVNTTRRTSVTFGCSTTSVVEDFKGSGVAGFGHGPLSFPSQMGITKFSYCIGFPVNFVLNLPLGTIYLGKEARIEGAAAQTVPLVKNTTTNWNFFYYLRLKGITVGNTRLKIPKEKLVVGENGGGIYIDSGAPAGVLEHSIFKLVLREFRNLLKLPQVRIQDRFECFRLGPGGDRKELKVPKLVFHFQGGDWVFLEDNYFQMNNDDLCFMFTEDESTSVLGLFQQFGTHLLFDLKAETLTFATGVSC